MYNHPHLSLPRSQASARLEVRNVASGPPAVRHIPHPYPKLLLILQSLAPVPLFLEALYPFGGLLKPTSPYGPAPMPWGWLPPSEPLEVAFLIRRINLYKGLYRNALGLYLVHFSHR